MLCPGVVVETGAALRAAGLRRPKEASANGQDRGANRSKWWRKDHDCIHHWMKIQLSRNSRYIHRSTMMKQLLREHYRPSPVRLPDWLVRVWLWF
jgi:hypothetical protein